MSNSNLFQTLNEFWPNAKCELIYHNDFQLLIAVALSARTTDKSVNKALGPLFDKNPGFGPRELINLGEKNFLNQIKTIGLAPTKAKNAVKIAGILLKDFQGKVPKKRENLEALPGVGRKTANVILNILYDEPVIAVDTHVSRVSQRLGLSPYPSNPTQVENNLYEVVPQKYLHKAHHLLIFHGRYLCTSQRPRCNQCPLTQTCPKIGVST